MFSIPISFAFEVINIANSSSDPAIPSAKAKQAYIKASPNSKYAKGVKSGEKEAPETGKQKKTRQSKEADDKAEKKASSARQAMFSKQRSRARGNSDDQYPF